MDYGNLAWLDSSTVHGIIGRYSIDSRERALGTKISMVIASAISPARKRVWQNKCRITFYSIYQCLASFTVL